MLKITDLLILLCINPTLLNHKNEITKAWIEHSIPQIPLIFADQIVISAPICAICGQQHPDSANRLQIIINSIFAMSFKHLMQILIN